MWSARSLVFLSEYHEMFAGSENNFLGVDGEVLLGACFVAADVACARTNAPSYQECLGNLCRHQGGADLQQLKRNFRALSRCRNSPKMTALQKKKIQFYLKLCKQNVVYIHRKS